MLNFKPLWVAQSCFALADSRKKESWLTYFEYFPAFQSLPRKMFTAELRECNLQTPEADRCHHILLFLLELFPHQSSSDQYQGHNSPVVHSQATCTIHKKETGPEWVQCNIQILSCSLKVLKNICKLLTPGRVSAFHSKSIWTPLNSCTEAQPKARGQRPWEATPGSLPLGATVPQLIASHCHMKSKPPLSSW